MDLLFLAFANSPENPLPTLKEEDDEVYGTLVRRSVQQHFAIHRDSATSVAKLTEYLVLFRDYITLFLYSGHAGRDALLLERQAANATGIAELLEQCPKLKLIILNGCSTQGQVERLLGLKNKPVVIATSAPVGDRAATQFSISFFQALGEQFLPVEEAFQAGIGAAKTVAGEDLSVGRGFELPARKSDQPVWGLFYETPSALQWKLPATPIRQLAGEGEANEQLIGRLIELLAPHSIEVRKIKDGEESGLEFNILDKREAILKALPHPVSEQLRKLLVPEPAGSKVIFYDRAGPDRLRQMVTTYQTMLELIAFIGLAQLWDALSENKEVELSAELTELLTTFFDRNRTDDKTYDYLPLIRHALKVLQKHRIDPFVSELGRMSGQLEASAPVCQACRFMKAMQSRLDKRNGMEATEAAQLCLIAEEKLATIIGHFGFLSGYTLASVKGIDVIKFRHLPAPQFKHHLVRLVQRFVGLAEEQQLLAEFMDNASILLLSSDGEPKGYLNLSPFIIDENAFDEKAAIAKLYFFDHYEKENDTYCFRHIYKPDDLALQVGKQTGLKMVKAQFDAFARLVFQHPLQETL